MFTLPLLVSDDIGAIDAALGDFISDSGARLVLFIDPGGFVITTRGDAGEIDTATLGALAANSFAATQAIAKIIEDHSVTSLYQQGEESSLLIVAVGDSGFIAIVFPAVIGVGSVKYYTEDMVARVNLQLSAASVRAPGEGLDLSALNIADATPLFRRRAATP
jgi:predicted regulator of Ras-like GTPase activity (Roadblock/LC7/MglB family)